MEEDYGAFEDLDVYSDFRWLVVELARMAMRPEEKANILGRCWSLYHYIKNLEHTVRILNHE